MMDTDSLKTHLEVMYLYPHIEYSLSLQFPPVKIQFSLHQCDQFQLRYLVETESLNKRLFIPVHLETRQIQRMWLSFLEDFSALNYEERQNCRVELKNSWGINDLRLYKMQIPIPLPVYDLTFFRTQTDDPRIMRQVNDLDMCATGLWNSSLPPDLDSSPSVTCF